MQFKNTNLVDTTEEDRLLKVIKEGILLIRTITWEVDHKVKDETLTMSDIRNINIIISILTGHLHNLPGQIMQKKEQLFIVQMELNQVNAVTEYIKELRYHYEFVYFLKRYLNIVNNFIEEFSKSENKTIQ